MAKKASNKKAKKVQDPNCSTKVVEVLEVEVKEPLEVEVKEPLEVEVKDPEPEKPAMDCPQETVTTTETKKKS